LSNIITADEKWVLYDNPKRQKQWLSAGQTPEPTPKPGLHPRKVILCVWWDCYGVVYNELLEMGQTITANIYCQQLDRLKAALEEKRPGLVNRRGVILQHDNARPHVAKETAEDPRAGMGSPPSSGILTRYRTFRLPFVPISSTFP